MTTLTGTLFDPDTNIQHLVINGEKISTDIAERITSADLELTINGASTFTIKLDDPKRKVLNSGLFSKRVFTVVDTLPLSLVSLQKEGDELQAVFEDTSVAECRRHSDPRKVDAATMSHTQFANMLLDEIPGIKRFVLGSDILSTETLHRGPINPNGAERDLEDTWECLGRIANARNWRRFSKLGVIWYVNDDYLFSQSTKFTWKEFIDGVDDLNFHYDTGEPVGSVTATVRAKRYKVLPGDLINFPDLGAASGVYVVASYKRSLFDLNATVEAVIRQPILPEPSTDDADLSLANQFESGLTTDGSDENSSIDQDAPPGLGAWKWPTNGSTITGRYGETRSTPRPHKHEGIDIGVKKGNPCWAANMGLVTFVGQQSGFGNLIKVQHAGGLESLYAHLLVFNAHVGQIVNAGDNIGKTGGHPGDPGAGDSRGDHLHFQINLNGRPVDPNNYVKPR